MACNRGFTHNCPVHDSRMFHGDYVYLNGAWVQKTADGVTAMAEDNTKPIEDQIAPILDWSLVARLTLLRHLRLQEDLAHVSTQVRDLELAIARESKK